MQLGGSGFKDVPEQIVKAAEPIAKELGPTAKKLIEEGGKKAGPLAQKAIEKGGPIAKKAVGAVAVPVANWVIDKVSKNGAEVAGEGVVKAANRMQGVYVENRRVDAVAKRIQSASELVSRGGVDEAQFRSLVAEIFAEQLPFPTDSRLGLLHKLERLRTKKILSAEQHQFVVSYIVGPPDVTNQGSNAVHSGDGAVNPDPITP